MNFNSKRLLLINLSVALIDTYDGNILFKLSVKLVVNVVDEWSVYNKKVILIMNLKKIMIEKIKRTDIYQKKKEEAYYSNRNNMLSKLAPDERYLSKKHVYLKKSKVEEYNKMFDLINITIRPGNRFQTWIDTGLYFSNIYALEDNITPNYKLIIDNSINDLIKGLEKYNNSVSSEIQIMLHGIILYIDRIAERIHEITSMLNNVADIDKLNNTKNYFLRMKDQKCSSMEEALQRILFWSSLFWQSQHTLIGIGRLDKLLASYELEVPDSFQIIKDFYCEMHRYFAFKSSGKLLGDTGQIIVLGGSEPNGEYFCNEYTYRLIEVMRDNPIPDPKILLRTSSKMPDDLLELAIQCISTGVGCPLLSNDDVVIPALEEFGYTHIDACNYVTSACWEPMVYGKSFEKNNIKSINYGRCFENTYHNSEFPVCGSFERLISLFLNEVDREAEAAINTMNMIKWERNPLRSLFTEDCIEKGKDISEGGAVYNNFGVLTVGLANAVDSLLNIKELCFEEKKFTLDQVKSICIESNFDLVNSFLRKWYGTEDAQTVQLVKQITDRLCDNLAPYRNQFGGKVKWGLSASNYVESGVEVGATFDGRNKNEPLAVHISAPSGVAYTELVSFASSLDYSGQKSNGNVVDYFVTPDFIKNNLKKFTMFIKASIKKGFFQMQMNVVSSKTLIVAKKDPTAFPNLIVRVWGFSAYFNDLPENYKDILIQRAIDSERGA